MISKSVFGFKGLIDPLAEETAGSKLRSDIRWMNVFLIVGSHIGLLLAPFYFTWSGFWIALLLTVVSGMAITFGWHRLLTHRSFETRRSIKLFFTVSGCLACQDGPIEWVGTHRIHHRYTEKDQDPHSPKHGFWWAHMGWIFMKPTYDHRSYAKDLLRDKTLSKIDAYWYVFPMALLPLLFIAGYIWGGYESAISWVIIAGIARVAVFYHFTWFVNSAAHRFGYRNFDTPDESTNLWWVAILTFGEGWHNNHHASQARARHGLKAWEIDMTYWFIWLLSKLGLVWNIRKN